MPKRAAATNLASTVQGCHNVSFYYFTPGDVQGQLRLGPFTATADKTFHLLGPFPGLLIGCVSCSHDKQGRIFA